MLHYEFFWRRELVVVEEKNLFLPSTIERFGGVETLLLMILVQVVVTLVALVLALSPCCDGAACLLYDTVLQLRTVLYVVGRM